MEQTSNPNEQNPMVEKMIDPLFASFCILVVDDSRTLRRILIRELNSLGFNNILKLRHFFYCPKTYLIHKLL